jgi:hypothetical protein
MTLKFGTTARKLKVTMVLDAAPLAALRIADGAPSRCELTVSVGGRAVVADLATKALRKVVRALADHGADGVVVLLPGRPGGGRSHRRCRDCCPGKGSG